MEIGKKIFVSVADILKVIFNTGETVYYPIFADKKDDIFQGTTLSETVEKYHDIEPVLLAHNAQNRCISFIVNAGGSSDAAITRINAQFVEMDNGSLEEQKARVDAFPLHPSLVIQTRKSLHVYWFMDSSAKIDEFRYVQKQLVKHFDGDPMCINESRALRLPGFNHNKTDTPVEVICLSYHPEYKYAQSALSDILPDVDRSDTTVQKPVVLSGAESGLEVVIAKCDFLQHCRNDAKTLPEPEWYAMITNMAGFHGGIDKILEFSAPYNGYSKDNTDKKIHHFFNSGTGPITCQKIHEMGFLCPKYASRECGVKSPAALCHKPMDVDALRDAINSLPVTHDSLKDAQTATWFVKKYMYNQDVTTADIVIGTDLCDHLHLPANAVKSLSKVYKDTTKIYSTSSSAKKAKTGKDLQPWYIPTDKGVRFLPGVLAQNLAKEQDVIYVAEQYRIYQNGCYIEMADKDAQKIVKDKMIPEETRMSQIRDAEGQWQLSIRKDIKELNPNAYIINLKNGLYNVLEDTLTSHSPDYYSTIQLNVNFDPQADCPRFKQFLNESMGGDAGQVGLIQEMLGYFLVPITVAQKCFVLVGEANAGKSVLLRVINHLLLGAKYVSNVSWQSLNERFKTAELFGKLANIFADLPTKNIDDNGIFKALVGEDAITVEKKHKDPFAFQSFARLLFSCNSIPKNYGDRSEGFYRRLIIITYQHAVAPDKRDPYLIEKLQAEADGIFQYALEGLRRLMANNFVFSETDVNKLALQRYREDSDSVLSFVAEMCELDPSTNSGSTEIYNAYKAYCEECGLKPYSQKSFVQQLTTSYPDIKRGKDSNAKRRILEGIKLGEILA